MTDIERPVRFIVPKIVYNRKNEEVDIMERRKKGRGQVTNVPGRKSPRRACVIDSTEKQKPRFFKTEKEAKAFLREVDADAN